MQMLGGGVSWLKFEKDNFFPYHMFLTQFHNADSWKEAGECQKYTSQPRGTCPSEKNATTHVYGTEMHGHDPIQNIICEL